MYKNLKSIALVALAGGVREKTEENREAAPVMIIDVESKEACSAQKENAYRTLEKFYRRNSLRYVDIGHPCNQETGYND